MNRTIGIDEEGFVLLNGVRLEDEAAGSSLLKNLERVAEEDRFVTKWDDIEVNVEAFDEPLVAKHVEREGERWFLTAPYHYRAEFAIESLCVDEWDRFHGVTLNKIAFVFARSGQMEFFDLVDSFDDDSVTVGKERIEVSPFYIDDPQAAQPAFWNERYTAGRTPWDLREPAPPLKSVLPQLKLAKARVLVLGCGSGEDAAYFAELGHVVTAVDFSPEAISRARERFSGRANLTFVEGDLFEVRGTYDVIFEHTCFAAVAASRRAETVRLWRSVLSPGGHLLAVFYVMSRRRGPPYGASEWELRERLKKDFHVLYWTRWQHSHPSRAGRELVVYAKLR